MFTYLALGDSYTIGESVLLQESFPYRTVQLLRTEGIAIAAPEIIAKTGYTTVELSAAIESHAFLPVYNVVSLLIGVNNQYRGHCAAEYEKEFKKLLAQAICFANGNSNAVFVLSIPDYSVTPFAQSMDTMKIQKEIQKFNDINYAATIASGAVYINITESTRRAQNNVNLLAADGLHPSAAEYKNWAQQLAPKMKSVLSTFNR